jgi:hypothetical protein
LDDVYATGNGEFYNRHNLPLLIEAAVKLWLGSTVVQPSHDGELVPGRHATLGPLGDLVDNHDVIHVVVVVVAVVVVVVAAVCVHFCFCERLFVRIIEIMRIWIFLDLSFPC